LLLGRARPGFSKVPPEVRGRRPVSPLEARVSPDFRAAMSVGKDTVSRNPAGGKRGRGGAGARMGDGWWITALIGGMGFRKLS